MLEAFRASTCALQIGLLRPGTSFGRFVHQSEILSRDALAIVRVVTALASSLKWLERSSASKSTKSSLVTRPVRSSSPPARSSTSDDISTQERPMGGCSSAVGALGRSVCHGKGPYGRRDRTGRVGGKSDFASKRRFFYVRWVGKG